MDLDSKSATLVQGFVTWSELLSLSEPLFPHLERMANIPRSGVAERVK